MASPRARHYAGQVGGKSYVWGGYTQDFCDGEKDKLRSTLNVFDPYLETWQEKHTTGTPPRGLLNGAYTSHTNQVYSFAGHDGSDYMNSLHILDTDKLVWEMHRPNIGPMPKSGCGMVFFGKQHLATIGGYGLPTLPVQPVQPESFITDSQSTKGRGWTNEFCIFDVTEGKWSSPPTIGPRPPPSENFTFTAINEHQAVFFGGFQPGLGRTSEVYIIDFISMEWTKVERPKGAPWPVGRMSHAACCLNYGDDQPVLLMTGGIDKDGNTLSDTWLLDTHSRRWKELTLPEGTKPRWGHTLTSCRIGESRVHATTFGGCPSYDPGRPDYDDPLMADTTVLEFESVQFGDTPFPRQWVLVGVADSSQLGTPERTKKFEELKQKSTEDAFEVQVEKALRKGYILTDLTTCLASGAPGSGKTHLRYLLYGLFPPEIRISTACIEEAQRAIISSLDSEDNEDSPEWRPVQSSELKEIVAEGVSAGVEGTDDQLTPKTPHFPESMLSESCTKFGDTTISHVPDTGGRTVTPVPKKPQPQLTTNTTTSQPSTAIVRQKRELTHTQAFELPETADVLKLMKTLAASRQPLRAHWMHYIDSGGQPQFLEVLAAFVRNISLLILLIKLSEELSAPPSVEYFSPDGKSHELGVFPLTNEQLLLQAAQLSLFHCSQISLPHVETRQSQMKTVIVGTFKDQENHCKETRGEKNCRLKQLLKPFQEYLIPRSKSEIIFPVNAKSAGQGEKEDPVASELRGVIQKFAPRLRMRFPLQWYFLEMELRKLGLKIITKFKCWEIARKLEFESKEALEAALQYLHEANLFLYYPDVLSNTVFIVPQVVISNITHLYEHHIDLKDAPDAQIISEDDLRYRDQALFTADNLSSLDNDYSKDVFPDDDLLKLLQHRLIVAEMPFLMNGKTCYMMPSLLPALEGKINRPQFTAASPLVVTFPEGWVPIGLCCAAIVSLLSNKAKLPLKIAEFGSSMISKLYKNRLEFSIGDHPGTVTLVNTMKQFELHPSSTLPIKLLPLIKQVIDQSLEEACSRFSYKPSHQFTFTCTCGASPSHAALISTDKSTMQCTNNPGKVVPLSDKQKLWMLPQDIYTGSDKVEMKDQEVQTEITERENQHIEPGTLTKQCEYLRGFESFAETSFVITGSHSHTFEWQGHGLKLHIPEGAMPEEHKGCRIDIKACSSGQFSFPNDSQLVSCVYWLSCSQKFLKSVTLEIEHCALVQNPSQSSSLRFVVANCSQPELPYQFKELKQGKFSLQSSYGSIQLSQFSILGIVWKMFTFYLSRQPRYYSSNLYYIKKGLNHWRVDFVIMWNLSGYREAVKKLYAGYASDDHLSWVVVFQEDTIKLTVDGEVLKNGWEIIPLTPPTITKHQVDSFRPGQQLPSCCLSVGWAKDGNPIKLKHRISLVGAMEPFDFFYIMCIPENPPIGIKGLRQQSKKRRREQEGHHSKDLKKVKVSSVPEFQEGALTIAETTTQMDEQEEQNILGPQDLADITSYLNPLDRTAVFNLGLVLGLDYNRLTLLRDDSLFLQDMLAGWLQRVDQVQKAGVPTWRRLVEALGDPRVGQNGIASNIEQDKQ